MHKNKKQQLDKCCVEYSEITKLYQIFLSHTFINIFPSSPQIQLLQVRDALVHAVIETKKENTNLELVPEVGLWVIGIILE